MSEENILKVTTENGVRLLTLNRPEVMNATNPALVIALAQAILDADHDPAVAVVAITGAGRGFCSGNDLRGARDAAANGGHFRGPLHIIRRSLFEIMIDSRKPLMAIVNGPAVAGGFELALACDVRVAAVGTFFAATEAKVGRGAHFASVILPQMVPMGIAMEWLYTARRIPMVEAERWGLVNRVVPREQLTDTAMALAAEISSSAPLSLQRLKLTFRKTQGLPLHAGIRLDAGPDLYSTEDQLEGARAFLEKRPPRWQGR